MRLHARTEIVAGCTTYLTMVYIVFVQLAMPMQDLAHAFAPVALRTKPSR